MQEVLTSTVVMHGCLGKHGIILDLCLPDRRAVVADQNQLGCATHRGISPINNKSLTDMC